ncbi:hypothetical protein ACFTWH_26645 [Streptomyces sp. NPDC057011]|uniref:hypothetical protein n=1 Tax=unclassified Streptomyces TaxID=2593676 RepID=UPI00362E281C
MRTALALRTSLVTAVVAGALLAPAAGAAFAAAPQTAATGYGTVSTGKAVTVKIGNNLVAIMTNSASEGPRVEIRVTDKDGKVGGQITQAPLDRTHTKEAVQGTVFALTKADSATPVLTVTTFTENGPGETKSFPLPAGEATGPGSCLSEIKQVQVGAGMIADLTMSPKGPKAVVYGSAPEDNWAQTLDRLHPKGSDDYYLRIANPSGAQPVLEWKTQGGDNVPVRKASFPALPKGCTLEYKVTEEQSGTPAPKPSATASATPTAAPKPQTAGQTSVVPKGGVAAGAEIAAEDTDNTTTVAAGAGLMAIFGALGASVVLRRRRATQG